jgi:tripartite-type tricarboxylate transporter receptor subunit TctC
MRFLRKILVAVASLSSVSACLGQNAGLGTYPNHPVQVVLGIGAGSTTDVLARIAAKRLSEAIKQPVVVFNRPGAGGTIAAEVVAGAPSDGYTLLFASSSLPLFPHMYDNLRFDPIGGLAGVGGIAEGGLVMVTRSNAPWKTVGELVEYAKSKPKDAVSYASAGIGSNAYVFSEIFAQAIGVQFVHVPYNSSAAALTDLMAGQVDFVFDGPATAGPQVAAGRVRALAFSTKNRSTFMPNVQSMEEAGVKGFAQRTWVGFFAPAGTPKEIVGYLSREIGAFVVQPSFRQDLASAYYEPWKVSGPELTSLVRTESEVWAVKAKSIKLK